MSLKSLESVISQRLLALKGRQITDGGKQRVAPSHGKLITPPSLRQRSKGGVGGGCGTWPGVKLRSPPSVLCRPVGAKSTSVYGSAPLILCLASANPSSSGSGMRSITLLASEVADLQDSRPCVKTTQHEARLVCLGQSKPRVLLRLCGPHPSSLLCSHL